MDSELLLKFIGYFPDYLSALSRTLLRFLWTTFVETAVCILHNTHIRAYIALCKVSWSRSHIFIKILSRVS